ncbi:hypothetical protein Y032_0411g961 [Ancylostoma ceylanicum]|uniref:Uncharacterized protein n=1 Tax=Ancylostoma ceylanicum TaxID=53326 RepID=A0A016X2F1_9BILA|nr:hypothetical protein Y032_0411g961 [Ancylostoma ceylanicum]
MIVIKGYEEREIETPVSHIFTGKLQLKEIRTPRMWLAILLLVPRIKCEKRIRCAEGVFRKPFTEQVLELKVVVVNMERRNLCKYLHRITVPPLERLKLPELSLKYEHSRQVICEQAKVTNRYEHRNNSIPFGVSELIRLIDYQVG